MFHDIIFVEMLSQDGTRDSYIIKPKSKDDKVITESYTDTLLDSSNYNLDLGGNHIYNFDECTMKHLKTVLQLNVRVDEFSFKIKHEGIPIGSFDEGRSGIYNLILMPGLRLTKIRIIDPIDNKQKEKDRKEIEYRVFWDNKYEVQLVEINLRSRRGSFSFVLNGSFVNISSAGEHNFVNCLECYGRLVNLTNCYNSLTDMEKKTLSNGIIEKLNRYVKIEPEIIPGVSINVNKALEDFQKNTIKNNK